MSDYLTVEIVLFKLKPGVEEATFLRAADAIMPDLRSMPGYVRRELLKGANGQWLDIIHWNSLEEANRAAQEIMQRPACHPFLGMIDETSITMLHPVQACVYNN